MARFEGTPANRVPECQRGWLCRDCLSIKPYLPKPQRCNACGSPRLLQHAELLSLDIAHIDCDAFYASVEKRDDPSLTGKPVIVGGGRRGVVAACCYVARQYGIHSAMPMFKALKLCPDAVIIRPRMDKYRDIGRAIRHRMEALTPLVEAASIDEAYLDLSGTQALHKAPPARTLAAFARDVEATFGLTVSIGLSYSKLTAKLASAMDKPRGFALIGRDEAMDILGRRAIGSLPGVGTSLERKLQRAGFVRGYDLQAADRDALLRDFGAIGARLHDFAAGRDSRPVTPGRAAKSVSAERTFEQDLSSQIALEERLWPLCRRVAQRLTDSEMAAATLVLKLKDQRFRTLTRNIALEAPTQLATLIFEAGRGAVAKILAAPGARRFGLVEIGAGKLVSADLADPEDMLDRRRGRLRRLESALGTLRQRHGDGVIDRGIGFSNRER